MNIESLNRRYSIQDKIQFRETDSGLAIAEIDNGHAHATICLQGGHVMTWQPRTQEKPVIWLSGNASLLPGKSIRGGVPVCWPWFGPHVSEPGFPAHGFARTVAWEITRAENTAGDETVIGFKLEQNARTQAMWPYETRLNILITLGNTLKIDLVTENGDAQDVVISEALHTYFQVGDIADIQILGLEDCDYYDKVAGGLRARQEGAIRFSAETDRVYVNTTSTCSIEDTLLKRRIRIAKSGSHSTVVWNPWQEKADKMGDLGPDGWRRMVCVESANAMDNPVLIPAGKSHTLGVEYSVEDM
jgi:glucose-6-phosphate 1-epimerase